MNAPDHILPDPRVEEAIDYGLSLGIEAPWETNGRGQIIVNPPPAYRHAARVMRIALQAKTLAPDWQATADVALHTLDGVKGPDLTLAEPGFAPDTDARGYLLGAPTLCVEVMSPANSWDEMRHKAMLYLAAGAREVWVCDEDGRLRFLDGAGERESSRLIPAMPARID